MGMCIVTDLLNINKYSDKELIAQVLYFPENWGIETKKALLTELLNRYIKKVEIMDSKEFFQITTYCNSEDAKLFVSVINQGIDSYLEGFTQSKFYWKDSRLIMEFHRTELPILIRRLEEEGTENALGWIADIEYILEQEKKEGIYDDEI